MFYLQRNPFIVISLLNLLSKCWACSIKNCDPCSHCLSNNCSKLCGIARLPLAPLPNIEAKGLGPVEATEVEGAAVAGVEVLRCRNMYNIQYFF